ncbi:retrotransposon protein, putative, ty1-copia subclass [Tanacetum coccineum]
MTPRLDIFFDFLECDGGSVMLGDNRECKIRGIGKVRLQLKDGSSFVLHNDRYIPELKRNLISLETLEKEGYTVKLQSGKVKVINGSKAVVSGTRRDSYVYSLDGHAVAGELNASVEEKDSLTQVWHKRLGHISEAGLQVLEKQGLFGKKSLGKLDFCENCVLGKSHRVSFGVGRHTTQGVIDYVHSDLWGPSQVESLGGKRFKHEAFGKFKEWKQLVENQTRRTVKKLRTDNGIAFCNREFEQLCTESGIARHLTVAGTPHQNGLAERMNRTLMDTIRCLLIQSGLPKTFWAEATCTTAYLINRSPSTAIEKKKPMEMWSGHPSDYGILYRLDGESPKIVTTRNMVFNESVMYKDTLKDSGAGNDKSVEELQEAIACEDSFKWKAAMEEEINSLRKNKTWELVDPPVGQKLRAGIDYNEVFSPVVLHTSIRVILALTACKDYELEQLDQSPRKWYRRFDEYMLSNGFKRSSYDSCIYYRSYAPGEYIYLLLYVDDMLIACKSKAEIGSTKSLLKKEFDIQNEWGGGGARGSKIRYFGMEIVKIGVSKISEGVTIRVSYANAVGSLMYLMVCTRPDIAYAVSIVSRFLANPGFVDSDYAKDPDKEAEYMALTKAVKEAIWLRGLLDELGIEVLEAKTVKVLKVGTEYNAADALTKVVLGRKLQHCLALLSVGVG